MPKAGRYDYPSRDLDDCVDFLRKAFDTSKSYVMTRDSFATAIGLSAKGGGFNLLVGSMSMFGLVDTGGGEIKYTELTKKILFGEPDERNQAMEDATRKITLFADIYDKFGNAYSDDQLRLFLKDKAVVDIAEANSLAQLVGKSLKNHVKYLTPGRGGEKKTISDTQTQPQTAQIPAPGQTTLTTPFGVIQVSDAATLEAARSFLNIVESRMKEEQKSQKPEPRKEKTSS